MKKTYGEYLTFTENKYYIAANYVMYVGIFILVTSVLGCCCASMPSNRYIMALFVIFVVIVLVMDIVAGSLVLVYREKVIYSIYTFFITNEEIEPVLEVS